MKSCFDGYLTEACRTCELWKNSSEETGCAAPFPIMNCEDFAKIYREEETKNSN